MQITRQMRHKGVLNSPGVHCSVLVPRYGHPRPFKYMGPPAEAPGIDRATQPVAVQPTGVQVLQSIDQHFENIFGPKSLRDVLSGLASKS
jgi:hypothetical protein